MENSSAPSPETPAIQRLPLPKCCDECACDGAIVLASRCHTGAGVFAVLTGNVLTLQCAICEALVTRLEVTCQLKGM